ncbi:hypothetical protein K493DRAFT_296471 [Basidiobolus meristosporus CBS 931.73]|uniref:Nucleotide exchange factor SIL1 n=1 Tax=Basidiobolus meristosporus CBS 931.73 TaxID=1314790 RepID=A0A1Y1Z598_9FUNG|nr:hypothetical protein K493DRAFT_296471 [Basidiobolus meristosporus CBS 931.73]|eukprot:ORY05420.1 hypothetical protein K493DRAFT_296471 [Basidiobolus meristosporus CBS 931.73]
MHARQYSLLILLLSVPFISAYVANDSSSDDVICPGDGACYPRIFEATTEFQPIKEGQEIPPGLHVRLNVYTGEKEAKLMDNEDTTADHSLTVNPEEEYSIVPVSNDTDPAQQVVEDTVPPKFNSEFRDSSKPNARIPQSDHQRFEANLKVVSNPTEYEEVELLEALDSMEDLVHEIDFGKLLAKNDGLGQVADFMDTKWSDAIRLKAATIIGSAVQNNPPVQQSALQLDLVGRMLTRISSEQQPKVLSRYMYALSSMVRGNTQAIKVVNEKGGLTQLAGLYVKHQNEDFRKKCAIFVADFLNPDMEEVEELTEQVEVPSNMLASEGTEDWCQHLQKTLLDSSITQDTKEKTIRGLSMVRSQAPVPCAITPELQPWIKSELIEFESDQDFDEYTRMLRSLEE